MSDAAFVRTEEAPRLPPPRRTTGPIAWILEHLFPTPLSGLVTVLLGAFAVLIIWTILKWAIVDAVWTGSDREACIGEGAGACWPFVKAKFGQWIYGFYPIDQRWRINLCFILGALALVPMLMPSVPYKKWNAIFLLAVYPLITFILLTGGNFDFSFTSHAVVVALMLAGAGITFLLTRNTGTLTGWAIALGVVLAAMLLLEIDFGLVPVETSQWGGLTVTLVVSVTGIVASLPLGILLALGRRSNMPIVKLLSVIFIEVWRGVPLITVLFMASNMLPLFLPPGVNFDKLLRALVGVALFSSAYMAEVVRGGLQAIPKGQYEAANALGLSYWRTMSLIILPQALKIVIPGIVNTFIGLFKDTTLLLVISLFDLLSIVQTGFNDAKWASPQTGNTGYFTLAFIYWLFCFGMSRYSIYTERRLHTGHKR
jgi:general L-amino acid transport system permease protein